MDRAVAGVWSLTISWDSVHFFCPVISRDLAMISDMVARGHGTSLVESRRTATGEHRQTKVKLKPRDGVTLAWADEFQDVVTDIGCQHILER